MFSSWTEDKVNTEGIKEFRKGRRENLNDNLWASKLSFD